MKNLFVALLVLICLKASSQCASQTVIQNPTFQGGGNNYSPPSPWLGCSATEWNNYTSSSGSVVVSSGIYNGAGVSQLLNLPLATGVLYTATIVTGAGGGICECQVWGGWSSCDASSSAQELWNSGNGAAAAATNTFTFHASQNFTYRHGTF